MPSGFAKSKLKDKLTGYVETLPVMCQTTARNRRAWMSAPPAPRSKRIDGIVLVDKHICIGCRYWHDGLPVQGTLLRAMRKPPTRKAYAPRGKGTVESCTLCVHRVDAGRIPACVEACTKDGNKAMVFGDLKRPETARSINSSCSATYHSTAPGPEFEHRRCVTGGI